MKRGNEWETLDVPLQNGMQTVTCLSLFLCWSPSPLTESAPLLIDTFFLPLCPWAGIDNSCVWLPIVHGALRTTQDEGWGGGIVDNVFDALACRPKFNPQHPCKKKVSKVAHAWHPSTETERSLGTILAKLVKPWSKWEILSQKPSG